MRVVAFLRRIGVGALVVAVLVVGGVGHGQRRTDPTLNRLASEFATAFSAKDAAKVASFYAEDAVLMSPDAPLVKGRGSIEAHYREEFRVAFSNVQLKPMESVVAGTYAFEAGTSAATRPGDGASRVETGKYVVIYKRVGNTWKIAYDIYNGDDPPALPSK